MRRVAVTGSSGKLGTGGRGRPAWSTGWDVVALDRVPTQSADVASTIVELTDFGQAVEALSGIDDRHDGVDAAGPPRRDPGARAAAQRGDVRQQHHGVLQRLQRRDPGRRAQDRLGVERDGARAAVRRAAAVRAGRRGVPAAPEQHVLAGQDARGGAGPPALPVAPRPVDDRAAVQQRHVPRGLRASSRPSTPTRSLRKWNLWGYIDARDGAQAVRRALEHDSRRRRRLHHRERRHRHVASERRAARRGVPRRAARPGPSARTRPCCRSTRPAASSGTSRGTPGGTRSRVLDGAARSGHARRRPMAGGLDVTPPRSTGTKGSASSQYLTQVPEASLRCLRT